MRDAVRVAVVPPREWVHRSTLRQSPAKRDHRECAATGSAEGAPHVATKVGAKSSRSLRAAAFNGSGGCRRLSASTLVWQSKAASLGTMDHFVNQALQTQCRTRAEWGLKRPNTLST